MIDTIDPFISLSLLYRLHFVIAKVFLFK